MVQIGDSKGEYTPPGGCGRTATSNRIRRPAPLDACEVLGAIVREIFGVGIAITLERPSPTSPTQKLGTVCRCLCATELSTR